MKIYKVRATVATRRSAAIRRGPRPDMRAAQVKRWNLEVLAHTEDEAKQVVISYVQSTEANIVVLEEREATPQVLKDES
jgi:hypothetical protein